MSKRITRIQRIIAQRKAGKPPAVTTIIRRRKPTPDKTWTKAKLIEFAESNGIEVSSGDNKSAILAKLEE